MAAHRHQQRPEPLWAAFTLAMRPAVSNWSSVSKDCSVLFPAVGCGLPVESNQPTPPPRIFTHSGLVAVSDEPILVPMANVW